LVILYPYGTVDFDDLPEKFQVTADSLPDTISEAIEQARITSLHNQNDSVNQASNPEKNSGNDVTQPASLSVSEELPEDGLDLKEHLANLEYLLIKQAVDESAGVVAHAATRLKMRRTTLVEKMRKYGIQRDVE
jgi:sigma-54 specific flagellar transcriptional regulator A